MIERPKIPSANISPGPNFKPKYANVVPETINIKVLVKPPNTPETNETCNARLGCPF